MESIITLTVEELAVLLSTADFEEETRALVQDMTVPERENELEAIFNSTVNQLRVKGIWDESKHKKGLNPINERTMTFLTLLATSEYMIRATNEKENSVLVLHYLSLDTWLYHHIDEKVIHTFAFIEKEKISMILSNFYSFTFESAENFPLSFGLSDEQFNLLSNPANKEEVSNGFRGKVTEEKAFSEFLREISLNDYKMDNISVFSVNQDRQLFLENLVFFFQSDQGVWLTKYDKESDDPVRINHAKEEKWLEILNGVEEFSYDIIFNRN